MAPLCNKLLRVSGVDSRVCVTAQHREMLDQVLDLFSIKVSYDLNVMQPNQGLNTLIVNVVKRLDPILSDFKPDMVLVHGDTTSTLAACLSAFNRQIPVGHVEAGLRTGNLMSPWPEEGNRLVADALSTIYFCPTDGARRNLIREGKRDTDIYVTGNTVIDALHDVGSIIDRTPETSDALDDKFKFLNEKRKLILVTGHRRESYGAGIDSICAAIRRIAETRDDVDIIYPVHPNPNIYQPVTRFLTGLSNVFLLRPLDYLSFVYLMRRCYLILTDSGGIQEEAPALRKPVLLMRETTEREEAVSAGVVRLVGTNTDRITSAVTELVVNRGVYDSMCQAPNPFGDGNACDRIVAVLKSRILSP